MMAAMRDKEPATDEATPLDEYPPEEVGERRAALLAGIEKALRQVERGETYTIEEVREMMKGWVRQ